MRSLKKVLALLVVLTMMLSTVAFASQYTDVKDDASYAEAVTTLSSLGLLKGDDKGNFNPDKTITRAEFAAVVVRTMGLGDLGKTDTEFSDVTSEHWGSGYVKMASQLGIIKGYGNGKFGPDNNVTYEQAVKMIVAALGYAPKAEALGGYPTGYMVVAAQEEITKGANGKAGENALRSIVAVLVYNALDVPLMEQTGFGTDISFEAMDGTSGKSLKTVLSEKLDVDKIEGFVTNNNLKDNVNKDADEKTVEIKYTVLNGKEISAETDDFEVGTVNPFGLLGQQVVAYVKDLDNSDAVLVSVAPQSGENETIEIEYDDINSIVGVDLKYEVDDDEEEVELSDKLVVVYNGGITADDELVKGASGNVKAGAVVKLLSNDGDDDVYEYAFITEYVDYVVDEVSSYGRVSAKDGTSVEFDKEDEDYDFSLTLDGNEIKVSDLKEWDVISVAIDNDDVLKVGLVSRETVTGMIKEEDPSTILTEVEYTIDGKQYRVSQTFADNQDALEIENEGTFYLNAQGKIAYFEKGDSSGATENYAYLFDAAYSKSIGSSVQIELFTAKGEWIVYDLDDEIDVNGVEVDTDNFTSLNSNTLGLFSVTQDGTTDKVSTLSAVKQLVTYKLNSSGQIKELNYNKTANDVDYISLDGAKASRTFNADTDMFNDGKELTKDTVVFNISNTGADKSDYSIIGIDSFEDDSSYTIALYDIEDLEIGAIVGDIESDVSEDNALFVVTSVRTANNDDDEEIRVIVGYEVGSDKQVSLRTVYVDDLDVNILAATGTETTGDEDSITKGSVIQYSGSEDSVEKIRVIYSKNMYGDGFQVPQNQASYVKDYEASSDKDLRIVFGTVYDKSNGIIRFASNADAKAFKVTGAKYIKYDYADDRVSTSEDFGSLVKYATLTKNGVLYKEGSLVLVKVYDGVAEEVVIIEYADDNNRTAMPQ